MNSESLFLLIVNNTTEVIETKTKTISKIIIVPIWSLDSDSTSEDWPQTLFSQTHSPELLQTQLLQSSFFTCPKLHVTVFSELSFELSITSSIHPSPSLSALEASSVGHSSELSPTPSPSVSVVSYASYGKSSKSAQTPSPSKSS